jgi:hypothetical protein
MDEEQGSFAYNVESNINYSTLEDANVELGPSQQFIPQDVIDLCNNLNMTYSEYVGFKIKTIDDWKIVKHWNNMYDWDRLKLQRQQSIMGDHFVPPLPSQIQQIPHK